MKREIRFATELRAEGQGDEMSVVGYAALFNTQSKDLGGFRETVAPGAFTRSLEGNADIKFLFNHDANRILGRTKSGTLTVSQDARGLKFRAVLDPASQLHRDIYSSIKRGDIDECSFAFTVAKGGQQWAEQKSEQNGNEDFFAMRTLTDVNLMDVSAVTYPAYGGTNCDARSLFPDGEVAEIRSAIEGLSAQRKKAAEKRDDDCYEEMISEVQKALNDKFPGDSDNNCYGGQYWVIETHADYLIACEWESGCYYKIPYNEDEVNETYAFGDPQEVEKAWVPADDNMRAYNRLAEFRTTKAKHEKRDDEEDSEDAVDDWDDDEIVRDADLDHVKAAKQAYKATKESAKSEYKAAKDAAKAAKDAAKDKAKNDKATAKEKYKAVKAAAKQALQSAKENTARTFADFLAEYRGHLENISQDHKTKADQLAAQAKAEKEAAEAADRMIAEKKAYREENGLLDDEDYEDNLFVDPADVYLDEEEIDSANRAALIAGLETRADGKVRTKKVGGKNLTKDKFAYVGDASRTETWKFPIHDAAHVRNALARWGQAKGIPEEKKAGVYRKIKAAAGKFGIQVSDEDSARCLAGLPLDEDEIRERRLKLAALEL